MASSSFRYSEQSEELEKIHGYLYDSNGFSLIYRDFKELLANRKLTYIFGPTVSKRYKEDLDFESTVEHYQVTTGGTEADILRHKNRKAELKRKVCLGKKRLFSAFEDIEEDEDEVDNLLMKAADLGPSTPPPPLPASSPIPLSPPVESSIPLPNVQIEDESRF